MRQKKIVRKSRELRYVLKSIPEYKGNAFVDAIKGQKDPRWLYRLFKSIPGIYVRSEYLKTDLDTIEVYRVYHDGRLIYEFTVW